jgi:hypothetical protein
MNNRKFPSLPVIIAGDLIVLLIVTVIGQAMHDTLTSGLTHFLTNFLPFAAGWFCTAPFLGAYNRELTAEPSQLWRPFWSAILAAPMGGLIRGLLLGAAVIPIFIIVMGGIIALSLLAWRVIFLLLSRNMERKRIIHG